MSNEPLNFAKGDINLVRQRHKHILTGMHEDWKPDVPHKPLASYFMTEIYKYGFLTDLEIISQEVQEIIRVKYGPNWFRESLDASRDFINHVIALFEEMEY